MFNMRYDLSKHARFTCAHCNAEFDGRIRTDRSDHRRFCSRQCSFAFHQPTPEKFWANVSVRSDDECWPWIGTTFYEGYGRTVYDGRVQGTHRIAWKLTNGPIPNGALVCHKCDNPPCCNPKHLFLGDDNANAQDKTIKGRNGVPKGTAHGMAQLTDEIVRAIRRLHATKKYTQRRIALMFNTTQANVALIVAHKTWRHVE
jgi:hypothetical protein